MRDGVHALRVTAAGELDVASAPALREVLHAAVASAPLVALDMHAITFVDASGLHVLEDSSLEALIYGKRLVLTRVPPHAARMLELCGLLPALEVLDVEMAA